MAEQSIKAFGGKWFEDKLEALRDYLRAYTTALKKTGFKLSYIDAFAGAGIREIPPGAKGDFFNEDILAEEAHYRHGSPLIALETLPAFEEFIFIDRDQQSLARLKEQISQFRGPMDGRIKFLHGDANQQIQQLAASDWRSRRAVAFLDPFALHVTWETLEKVAKTQAIDMWLLFPAMAVNRMLTKNGSIPEAWATKLTETFGSDDWREFFYSRIEADLFGHETDMKESMIFEKLSEYMTLRLKTIFAGVHDKPLILRNSTNAPLFLLCFACGNPRAVTIATRIAQHIINKRNRGR